MPADSPDLFEHYQILRRPADGSQWVLGRGNMGVTYKAVDTRLKVTVALKIMDPKYADNEMTFRYFLREARAAAALNHRNIARVLHLSDKKENCFYAMEFIDGETIGALVKRRQMLPASEALPIVQQVARALTAAHDKQLVHRDIKPENIMLVNEVDEQDVVKLIDFGLAKSFVKEGHTLFYSQAGAFSGTCEFASPEQIQKAELDCRSDIYSLGVTLWYMLAGTTPFKGNFLSVSNQHVGAEPPYHKLPEDLHPEVTVLLSRMLAKDPADRPQNPADLRHEVKACLEALEYQPVVGAAAVLGPVVEAVEPVKTPLAAPAPLPAATDKHEEVVLDAPDSYKTAVTVIMDRPPPEVRKSEILAEESTVPPPPLPDHLAAPPSEVLPHTVEQPTVDPAPLEETPSEQPDGTELDAASFETVIEEPMARPKPEPAASIPVQPPSSVPLPLPVETPPISPQPEQAKITTQPVREPEPTPISRVPILPQATPQPPLVLVTPPTPPTPVKKVYNLWLMVAAGLVAVLIAVVWLLAHATRQGPPQPSASTASPADTSTSASSAGPASRPDVQRPATSTSKPASTGLTPKNATTLQPYINDLGMKFVPLPATKILFGVHPVTRKNFEVFAQARSHDHHEWEKPELDGVPVSQGDDDPVVMVSWEEAQEFCAWLSGIDSDTRGFAVSYRLPTVAEWRKARGNGDYPWGNQWPPPPGAGNYADETAANTFRSLRHHLTPIPGYNDGFATTSPVDHFAASTLGLHDIGGNVRQWCFNLDNQGYWQYVGSSWQDADRLFLMAKNPGSQPRNLPRTTVIGFRCVLELPSE